MLGGVLVVDAVNNSILTTISTGEAGNIGCALYPDGSKLYVVSIFDDPFSGAAYVDVINKATNSLTTSINLNSTEQKAGYIGVTPDGTKAYVTNTDENTVSVLNLTNNTLATQINVGASSFKGSFIRKEIKNPLCRLGRGDLNIVSA